MRNKVYEYLVYSYILLFLDSQAEEEHEALITGYI